MYKVAKKEVTDTGNSCDKQLASSHLTATNSILDGHNSYCLTECKQLKIKLKNLLKQNETLQKEILDIRSKKRGQEAQERVVKNQKTKIEGLTRKVEERDNKVKDLEKEIQQLKQLNGVLEMRNQRLTKRIVGKPEEEHKTKGLDMQDIKRISEFMLPDFYSNE